MEEQPYNKIKVYKDFRISLEPLDEELLFESDIYWRKINQNPKSTEFNHDEDAQWFMIPKDLIAEGEYDATVVLDNDDVPRHLVCNV